jgi:hypothetical protein
VSPEDRPFTEAEANAVFDILVEECRAPGPQRDQFVYHQTQADFPREWRFGGALGFGGKLWRNDDRVYVSCYSEDSDEATEAIIARANARLAEFVNVAFPQPA